MGAANRLLRELASELAGQRPWTAWLSIHPGSSSAHKTAAAAAALGRVREPAAAVAAALGRVRAAAAAAALGRVRTAAAAAAAAAAQCGSTTQQQEQQ
ncbi:hypothetical protein Emag_000257 [Eimeria magna]